MAKEIAFDKLPQAAKDLISEEQKSYIDEFKFYMRHPYIEAWYADELIATWNGKAWE